MSVLISGYFGFSFVRWDVGGINGDDESSVFAYASVKLQDASYIKNVSNSERAIVQPNHL